MAAVDGHNLPALFPEPWASEWGEDGYGLWMAFEYRGVRHALRWIPPGSFWMGSPLDEAERRQDETRHEVTLSEGFWLGETTVTQALWEAILGENPSQFKGAERPVERVSWEDAARFIEELNTALPGLGLSLPTEAQWEYACRAGSETPFSFGAGITPEQVNYDGNLPYSGGEKGLNRQETVAVKALPCNRWGLYQMHGNVWEWCQDGYGDYPPGPVTDPGGVEGGDGRVLRGGSWFFGARGCRSAYRYLREPGARNDGFGFRLARGRMGQTGRPVRSPGGPP